MGREESESFVKCVDMGGEESESFVKGVNVRQGCDMPPSVQYFYGWCNDTVEKEDVQ